jgi:hypothetical protein
VEDSFKYGNESWNSIKDKELIHQLGKYQFHGGQSFGRSQFKISTRRAATLIVVFRNIPQTLQTISGIIAQIMPRPCTSISSPVYYSVIIVAFNAISSGTSVIKQTMEYKHIF